MGRKERAKFCRLKLKRFLYLISPNKIKINFYKDLEEVLCSNKVKYFQLRLKNYSFSSVLKIGKKNHEKASDSNLILLERGNELQIKANKNFRSLEILLTEAILAA